MWDKNLALYFLSYLITNPKNLFRFFNTSIYWIQYISYFDIENGLSLEILDKRKVEDILSIGGNWEDLSGFT